MTVLSSKSLGDVLRQAFVDFKAERINRCVWYGGYWNVWIS